MLETSSSSIPDRGGGRYTLLSTILLLQSFAALFHALVVGTSWAFGWPVSGLQIGLFLLNALVPLASVYARTLDQLNITGFVAALCLAMGAALLAAQTAQPMFWFLPIGLCITLPSAAIHSRVSLYALMLLAVWGLLAACLRPSLGLDVDSAFLCTVVFADVVAGLSVCVSFCKMRHQTEALQSRLHAMAHVDELTGLPNRRAFFQALEQLLAQHASEENLYFLMLDVDNFKEINDRLGHDVGDQALVAIAQVLKAQGRGLCLARLGGEEFSMAGRMDRAEALALASALVAGVGACRVQGHALSLSVGLARRTAGEPAGELMRRADLALYEAKQAGKNRHVLAHEAPVASLSL